MLTSEALFKEALSALAIAAAKRLSPASTIWHAWQRTGNHLGLEDGLLGREDVEGRDDVGDQVAENFDAGLLHRPDRASVSKSASRRRGAQAYRVSEVELSGRLGIGGRGLEGLQEILSSRVDSLSFFVSHSAASYKKPKAYQSLGVARVRGEGIELGLDGVDAGGDVGDVSLELVEVAAVDVSERSEAPWSESQRLNRLRAKGTHASGSKRSRSW